MDKTTDNKTKKNGFVAQEIELMSFGTFRFPCKAKKGSIGFDLTVTDDFFVPARSRVAVPLNFALNLPYGIEAKIEPRSGFSLNGFEGYGTKKVKTKLLGFIPWHKKVSGLLRFDADVMVGKIDPKYTDNIHVIISNRDEGFLIKAGTRIAQMTFYKVVSPTFKPVETLSCKSRGGGLGSSGTKEIEK